MNWLGLQKRSTKAPRQARLAQARLDDSDSHNLDPFNSYEPGRCAVFVESGLESIPFDGGDTPPSVDVECLSQLFLRDRMGACIGTEITEAHDVKCPFALGH